MHKKLCLFLALLMAASTLFACGESASKETETDAAAVGGETAAVEETVETEETENFDPGLPAKDFGGRTFTFMTKTPETWNEWGETSISATELTGEVLNDAVYNRNSYVQETYNVVLNEFGADSSMGNSVGNAVKAGDSQYDVIMPPLNIAGSLVHSGYLLDLKTVENMNLSQKWWDERSIEDLSIANKLYMVSGDISTLNSDATWCTAVNTEVLNNLGVESPYQYVAEDKWNFDTYKMLCEDASIDLDGDGEYGKNDSIANLTQNEDATAMLIAFGYHLINKDENDIPYFDLEGNERVYDILTNVSEFMLDDKLSLNYHEKGAADGYHLLNTKMFEENRGLFWITNLQLVIRLREMETDFGIAPCPKYDEQQEDYCNVVWFVGSYATVPVSALDPAESGFILEAMAAKSRETLRPAYFETALSLKYLRDQESIEMLDLVIDNRAYELEQAFAFGSSSTVESIVLSGKDPASTFASASKNITTKIEKTLEEIGK